MLPISVCIMTCNEEEVIEAAIKSVSPYVKEVVVLDTGSTDKTIQLATNLGAKVFNSEWNGDFSEARNKLIALSEEEFIFMMDADESYEGTDKELKEYITGCNDKAGRVKIINDLGGDESSTTYVTRIFPKGAGYYYKGCIHEQLTKDVDEVRFISTKIIVHHSGYKKETIRRKKKIERNIGLLEKELEIHNNNPYIYYQLGRTYYVSGQYVDAANAFRTAYQWIESHGISPIYESSLFLQLGYSLMKMGSWEDFDLFFAIAIQKYSDYTDLYFMYGVSIIEGRRGSLLPRIPELFKKCISMGEPDSEKYETVKGVGSFKALYNLGLYYEITGEKDQAKYYYNESAILGNKQAVDRLKEMK